MAQVEGCFDVSKAAFSQSRRHNHMRFNDIIIIDAPSHAVWQYVGSPDLWSLFHSKAERAKQLSSSGGTVGSLYEIEFRMGSKTTPTRCEIIDLRIGSMIQVKSVADQIQGDCQAHLTYELEDMGQRTKVTERIDMSDSRIPFFFRAIIWLISRFGRPTGETTLMQLKRMVEEECS